MQMPYLSCKNPPRVQCNSPSQPSHRASRNQRHQQFPTVPEPCSPRKFRRKNKVKIKVDTTAPSNQCRMSQHTRVYHVLAIAISCRPNNLHPQSHLPRKSRTHSPGKVLITSVRTNTSLPGKRWRHSRCVSVLNPDLRPKVFGTGAVLHVRSHAVQARRRGA